jgi:mRNA interferase MazF
MRKPTVTFERFDVIRVPFPFTDRNTHINRPALVLSSAEVFNAPAGHSVMAMITSARGSAWPLDYSVKNLASAGLPVASLVRMKLFTLDHRFSRGTLGSLAEIDRRAVTKILAKLFALQT